MCRLVCIITILWTSAVFIYAQDVTPTPQPLLGIEGCNPPCWNGLIPGVTNSRDAINIILGLNDRDDEKPISWLGEIEPETLLVINGSYGFEQQRYIHIDRYNYWTNVTVDILDERVERIQVSAHQLVTIADVFEQLGRPDYVYHIATQASFFQFIYLDELTRVHFRVSPSNLLEEECTLADYGKSQVVSEVIYFSELSAYDTGYRPILNTEPVDWDEIEHQPAILAFPPTTTVNLVDPITLEQFILDQSDTPCSEVPLPMREIDSIEDLTNEDGE